MNILLGKKKQLTVYSIPDRVVISIISRKTRNVVQNQIHFVYSHYDMFLKSFTRKIYSNLPER
jgi:hypothetical protein